MNETSEMSLTASRGVWGNFLDALKGTPRDYTTGPIGPAIFALGVPMVAEMLLESVFVIVDIFFVGRLGAQAVATVGLTESLMTIVYTVAMGLSIGSMALVSRRIGEKDSNGAADAAVQSLLLGIVVSLVIGIVGVIYAPQLLSLMGASQEVLDVGSSYARMMLGANVAVVLLFLANAICRGAGAGAVAMRSLVIANLINVGLAPALIFGWGPFPELGLMGAAVATCTSRGFGALYTLSTLVTGKSELSITARSLRIQPKLLLSITQISASGMLQMLIGTASWIGLVRVISTFGSDAVAGYTIGIRILLFALLPSFGLANAAATMVGQALGARKPERAEKAVWMTGFYNLCFLGVVGIVFIVIPGPIVSMFTSEPAVMSYGVSCLRTIAYGFLFYAHGMVLIQSFNGAGDTWTPTKLNFLIFWCFEIPLAYLLSVKLNWGPSGAFWAVTLAFSTFTLVAALLFRRGTWKTAVV